mmetsp:Transcript_17908/g.44793  ORF Transcript_17908/g.44793 Transcript_17908/m.44793 type:complete len:81 (+) Transcript_17908:1364-1606(+)
MRITSERTAARSVSRFMWSDCVRALPSLRIQQPRPAFQVHFAPSDANAQRVARSLPTRFSMLLLLQVGILLPDSLRRQRL